MPPVIRFALERTLAVSRMPPEATMLVPLSVRVSAFAVLNRRELVVAPDAGLSLAVTSVLSPTAQVSGV